MMKKCGSLLHKGCGATKFKSTIPISLTTSSMAKYDHNWKPRPARHFHATKCLSLHHSLHRLRFWNRICGAPLWRACVLFRWQYLYNAQIRRHSCQNPNPKRWLSLQRLPYLQKPLNRREPNFWHIPVLPENSLRDCLVDAVP